MFKLKNLDEKWHNKWHAPCQQIKIIHLNNHHQPCNVNIHVSPCCVFAPLTMMCIMSVYRCNLDSIEKHQLFGSDVSWKGSALYLPAFHSRHHLFVPSGRKFSGRNNDQTEAGLWRQESKNSSRWIEGIDNDSVFRQTSKINHRARGEEMEKRRKEMK